jgi:hypothetical protein
VLIFSRLFNLLHIDRTCMSAIAGNAMCSNGMASIGRNAVWPAMAPQFRVTQLRPGGPSGGQGVIEPTAPHPGERSTWAAGLAGTEGFSLALPPVGGGLTTSATSAGTGNTIAAREA